MLTVFLRLINDRPILLKHLCVDDGKLKWFGSLEELKSFHECSVGLVGEWTSPGGDAKNDALVLLGTLKSNAR